MSNIVGYLHEDGQRFMPPSIYRAWSRLRATPEQAAQYQPVVLQSQSDCAAQLDQWAAALEGAVDLCDPRMVASQMRVEAAALRRARK